MKIVLDTNVLISGFLTTTGLSQYVVSLALKRHSIVLSRYILHEFQKQMENKLKMPHDFVKQALDYLQKRTVILEIQVSTQTHFSDQKDIPILNLLETAKPHYFITGDKKLQALKKFGQTLILSPREAMEVL